MAFTYQINDDVVWNYDKKLLKLAEKNKPKLHYKTIKPKSIVNLEEDEQYLASVKAIASSDEIDSLPELLLGRDDSIILDLGEHYVGRFSVDIDSVGSPMDAPLYIRIRFAEVPAELKYRSEDYDGWLSKSWIEEEFIHLDELPGKLEMSRRYSCRYIEITVIDSSPKWKASFSNPIFTSVSSVTEDSLPKVEIQDQKMKDIYKVSLKTIQNCMQDVYEDGPKRDRRLWLGDLRLQALANYSTFKDESLVKRGLYLFAGMTTEEGKIPANVFTSPKVLPDDTFLFDYSLFFTCTLFDYYNEFENIEVLNDLYSTSKKSIDLALTYVDEEGRFIEDEEWPIFCDWSNEFNKTTAGQAIIIYTLKRFINLMHIVGDNTKKYQQILDKMIDFSKEVLFDDIQNQFLIEDSGEVNIASQVWMTLAEVFDEDKSQEIMKQSVKKLFPITGIATPYMYHHIVEALFLVGLKEEGEKLMRNYWGKMVDMGADTFWEAFAPEDPNYSPYGSPIISSFCHAWSCTPPYLIKRYLPELIDYR